VSQFQFNEFITIKIKGNRKCRHGQGEMDAQRGHEMSNFQKNKNKKNKIKREGIRKKKGSQTTYSLACVKKRK
jgi:hypothetical protein